MPCFASELIVQPQQLRVRFQDDHEQIGVVVVRNLDLRLNPQPLNNLRNRVPMTDDQGSAVHLTYFRQERRVVFCRPNCWRNAD